jgi:hypothetical protein
MFVRSLGCACVAAAGLAAVMPIEAQAAAPWWEPVALRGERVVGVQASGRTVIAQTADGRTFRSQNGGEAFAAVSSAGELLTPLVQTGDDVWALSASGTVLHAHGGAPLAADPAAPALGRGARLLAAPAALPGVVVAVSSDGTVWRRAQDATWARSLVLLPSGFPGGVPRVTSVAAFTQPLSGTIYLATDGYSVLNSTDGGDDWFRAGPGMPDNVYALAADSGMRAVFAGTSDGLWIHRLRALPAPPAYRDAALALRWLGIAVVSILAAVAGIAALRGLIPRPART